MDEPITLGRNETGAKTAMPIFKDFIKKAVKKKNARPFKVAENISMMVIDPISGTKANFGSKKTIIEVFKKQNMNELEKNSYNNNRINKNNVLKFY